MLASLITQEIKICKFMLLIFKCIKIQNYPIGGKTQQANHMWSRDKADKTYMTFGSDVTK